MLASPSNDSIAQLEVAHSSKQITAESLVVALQKLTPEELISKFSSYIPTWKDIISGKV